MKLPYSEGSVFLVPLRDDGYARGVVARSGKRGKVLLGYFFGPQLTAPQEVALDDLTAENAVLCYRFGDLGLVNGEWPVVGSVPNWERSKWPMPDFLRRDALSKKAWLVRYSDDDPNRVEVEHPTDFDSTLGSDALAGYGALEIMLTKLLSETPQSLNQVRADDLDALKQLQAVSNTEKVHAIRHYLYFPQEQVAQKVATTLREHGFVVEDRLGADDVNWLVLVSTQAVPTESAIAEMRAFLERIAAKNNGEYDGWEAAVVTDPHD